MSVVFTVLGAVALVGIVITAVYVVLLAGNMSR